MVVGIIALLISVAVTVSGYVTKKAKIRNTQATIGMLVSALEAYKEYEDRGASREFDYPPSSYTDAIKDSGDPANIFYVEQIVKGEWGASAQVFLDTTGHTEPESWQEFDESVHPMFEAALFSIEVLHLYLDDVPASREVLNRISGSMKANAHGHYVELPSTEKELVEISDGWKLPLRYETRGGVNFPLIRSAGPDGQFDTADDILSSEL